MVFTSIGLTDFDYASRPCEFHPPIKLSHFKYARRQTAAILKNRKIAIS